MLDFLKNRRTLFVIIGVYIIPACGWSEELGNATWQWESVKDDIRKEVRRTVNIKNISECNHEMVCHGFTEVAAVDVTDRALFDLITRSLYPCMLSAIVDRARPRSVFILYDNDSAWMIRDIMCVSSLKFQLYNMDDVSVQEILHILMAATGGDNSHEYLILTICSLTKTEIILQSVNAMKSNKRNQSAVHHFTSWVLFLPALTANDFEVRANRINNVLVISETTDAQKKYKTMSVKTLIWHDSGRKFSNVAYFQTWTEITGKVYLSWLFRDSLFPNSRFGLNGQLMQIAALPWPPFVNRILEDNKTTYEGICIDILQEMAMRLNFTYNIIEPKDQQWGTLVDGRWTGLIGLVADEVVDLAAGPISIQPQRLQDVDFLHSFYYESYHIMIKQPGLDTNVWTIFAQPFSSIVWICVAAAIFFMSAAICVLRFTVENSPLSPHSYTSSLWAIIRSILRQGTIKVPKYASQVWIWGSFGLMTVILIESYCSVILSHLAVQKLKKLPFYSIEEMIQQTEYKWGTLGGTYVITQLQTSPLPAFQDLWSGMLKFNETDPDVLTTDNNILVNKVKRENFVILADASSIDMEQAKNCEVTKTADSLMSYYYAFPLPKQSPYKALFSQVIQDMEERGWLKHYKEKWWPKLDVCLTSTVTVAKPISIQVMQPAGVLLCFGVLISFVCLIIEWTLHRKYSYWLQC